MSATKEPEDETRDWRAVVCPWCAHEHRDVFEMVDYRNESSTDGECALCDKPIRYRVEIHHTYICEPITE